MYSSKYMTRFVRLIIQPAKRHHVPGLQWVMTELSASAAACCSCSPDAHELRRLQLLSVEVQSERSMLTVLMMREGDQVA